MTSRGMNVSFGLPGYSILFSPFQEYITVLGAIDDIFTETLNENPRELVFSDYQRLALFSILEQIV